MADSVNNEARALRADETMLTAARTAALVAYATIVWFGAALFIRYAGPTGLFHGPHAILLYALTVPATVLVNRRALKLSGLPPRHMTTVISVTTATATVLDAAAMNLFPGLYGPDAAIMGAGAIWLLWAIGVASALAAISTLRPGRAG